MVFSSLTFIYMFLPLLFAAYFLVPGRGKNIVLLLFSLLFYFYGEPGFLWLLLFSCFFNYVSGLLLEKFRLKKGAGCLLFVCLAVDFGWLFYFKYTDFFIKTVNEAAGTGFLAMNIALPAGISFFTFQTAAYLIDVYHEKTPACTNILDFSAYVCLFPQLVAGPIVRYQDISRQMKVRKHSFEDFTEGFFRFSAGLGKKVILADSFGMFCQSFEMMQKPGILSGWLLAVGYVLWIYFDFSGYSDMAIGLGRMFGFTFPENFNYPLISASVTEFWRRWHMTLSLWFKDYVYIPLGGNKKGRFISIRNIFIVWALTGLWHGAGWQFVLWGLFFAVFITAEKAGLLKWLSRHSAAAHIYMFFILTVSFVIFQSPDMNTAIETFKVMAGFGGEFFDVQTLYLLRSYAVLLTLGVIGAVPTVEILRKKAGHKPWFFWLRAAVCTLIFIVCTAYLTDTTYRPFLYFRF